MGSLRKKENISEIEETFKSILKETLESYFSETFVIESRTDKMDSTSGFDSIKIISELKDYNFTKKVKDFINNVLFINCIGDWSVNKYTSLYISETEDNMLKKYIEKIKNFNEVKRLTLRGKL